MNEATEMKTLRRAGFGGVAVVLCALLVGACELDVTNPNAPDTERALATPSDVESLIVSSFNAYWDVSQSNFGGVVSECGGTAWMAVLTVLADQATSGWSNYGMIRTAGEPRTAIPNSRANEDSCLMTNPWFRAYQGLAAAREGLLAIQRIQEAGNEFPDAERARAWAKFTQGLLHGMLALLFDKAFLVDENTELVDDAGNAVKLPFASYQEMGTAAIGFLNEAIAIASANQFQTPATWLNGQSRTSDELAALINGYIARFMARIPRSPAERAAVDWTALEGHLDQAHGFDFTVQSDFSAWWSGLKVWGTIGGPIQLATEDYRFVGQADQSGTFQAYMATPLSERDAFDIESPDARIPEPVQGQDVGCFLGLDHPACGNGPSFIGYNEDTFFPRARGLYQLSHYSRYEQHFSTLCNAVQPDFSWTGQNCEFSQRDLAFLKAEARMRNGDPQGAADIINQFRVPNGELPEATADGVQGQENCVPRLADNSCGDLLDVLAYEKQMAIQAEHAGDIWADKRGWGMLVSGSAIQLPIPARELETIGEEIYTFGGAAGGAAPIIQPGDLESVLAKVRWSLDVLEAQRRARQVPDLAGFSLQSGPPTGIFR